MADLAPWLTDLDGRVALRIGRCRACGRRHGPARSACPWCGAADLDGEAVISGTVLAATTTLLPVPGGDGPFHTVVLVELDPDVVVAGRFDGEGEPAAGTEVHLAAGAVLGPEDAAATVHRFVVGGGDAGA